MIKRMIFITSVATMLVGCADKKFERVVNTPSQRYDIVYADSKCGVFDNDADSLVTPIEYESLAFLRRAVEDSVSVMLFSCIKDGHDGMIGILEQNNEKMEVLFPR